MLSVVLTGWKLQPAFRRQKPLSILQCPGLSLTKMQAIRGTMSEHDTNKEIAQNQCLVVNFGPGMLMKDTHILKKTANVNEGKKDIKKKEESGEGIRHPFVTGKISARRTPGSTKDGRKGCVQVDLLSLHVHEILYKAEGIRCHQRLRE